jgi:hypothetical protein
MLTQAKTEADKIIQNPPKVENEESKKASVDEDLPNPVA